MFIIYLHRAARPLLRVQMGRQALAPQALGNDLVFLWNYTIIPSIPLNLKGGFNSEVQQLVKFSF